MNPYSRYHCVGLFSSFALKRLGEWEKYFESIGDYDIGVALCKFARERITELRKGYSDVTKTTTGRMLILLDKWLKDYMRLRRPLMCINNVLLKILPDQKNKIVSDALVYFMIPETVATEVDINMQPIAMNFHCAKSAEKERRLEEFLHPETKYEHLFTKS